MGKMIPLRKPQTEEIACCGAPPGPPSSSDEHPGYMICSFVDRFTDTPAGKVPKVKTALEPADIAGTMRARLGIGRNSYKIAPGLYCTGTPGPDSPVLVTANWKLSFDTLRQSLKDTDAWILVADTRGINVWCAAGKGNFSAQEVADRIRAAGLDKVVNHRKLVLPQLSATGVCAQQVKKASGFEVVWGPVRAADIPAFLNAEMKAGPSMRCVTFSLWERAVLTPVEISLVLKPAAWTVLILFLLSGFGPGFFSFTNAWHRGCISLAALTGGILAGAVSAPILLPWLPGTAFALKGAITGAAAGFILGLWYWSQIGFSGAAGIFLFATALSSYLTMNFTGSTPFTSPSGVEKEMRKAIPLQAVAVLLSALFWVGGAF